MASLAERLEAKYVIWSEIFDLKKTSRQSKAKSAIWSFFIFFYNNKMIRKDISLIRKMPWSINLFITLLTQNKGFLFKIKEGEVASPLMALLSKPRRDNRPIIPPLTRGWSIPPVWRPWTSVTSLLPLQTEGVCYNYIYILNTSIIHSWLV